LSEHHAKLVVPENTGKKQERRFSDPISTQPKNIVMIVEPKTRVPHALHQTTLTFPTVLVFLAKLSLKDGNPNRDLENAISFIVSM